MRRSSPRCHRRRAIPSGDQATGEQIAVPLHSTRSPQPPSGVTANTWSVSAKHVVDRQMDAQQPARRVPSGDQRPGPAPTSWSVSVSRSTSQVERIAAELPVGEPVRRPSGDQRARRHPRPRRRPSQRPKPTAVGMDDEDPRRDRFPIADEGEPLTVGRVGRHPVAALRVGSSSLSVRTGGAVGRGDDDRVLQAIAARQGPCRRATSPRTRRRSRSRLRRGSWSRCRRRAWRPGCRRECSRDRQRGSRRARMPGRDRLRGQLDRRGVSAVGRM